ncbi:MAG: anhydro-N-acetylmuramic acid kinase, partial [Deltaproteobacteria bacterium]|nr:anhydro-N-acetylmuramic acid kinase [Deltaproteobacteria bacterium]
VACVSDFRPMDIALGGEGAPLTPYFHWVFFKNRENLAVHNLGGFSNVTVIPKKNSASSVFAFDTGPANYVINLAMRLVSHGKKDFDKDGELAKKGEVSQTTVEKWMKHPFFRKQPPKSCSIEVLGKEFLEDFKKEILIRSLSRAPANEPLGIKNLQSKADKISTVTEFVARSIVKSYDQFILPRCKLKEVVFCGGGAHNKTLMNVLSKQLFNRGIRVSYFDDYGISGDAVEAVSFAYFGYLCLNKKVNHLPQVTGALKSAILGKISYPSI